MIAYTPTPEQAAAQAPAADPEPTVPAIPDGYYAVPDPDRPDRLTLWRAVDGALRPSPASTRYGPVLLKRDLPPGMPDEQRRFIRGWHETVRGPWDRAVRAAIAADPETAGSRFAETAVRCRDCGRPLYDETSKADGRGPDCRAKAGAAS